VVQRSGARTVELLMPYDYNGMKVDAITLGPFVLDHQLRWKQAGFKDWFELMVELTVINGRPASPDDVRQLRYPDADRVIDNFMQLLPEDIRQAIQANVWPQRDVSPPTNGQMPSLPAEMPEDMSGPMIDPLNVED
jgi:hypothetical protein